MTGRLTGPRAAGGDAARRGVPAVPRGRRAPGGQATRATPAVRAASATWATPAVRAASATWATPAVRAASATPAVRRGTGAAR
ncbi:hypothetical protein FHS43_006546 [Streptosporangium becharense]|uniref:hypothetical protein n=1 Tax=Streptosporangium becharense TaxID=1816182 RepID=UPI00160A47EA|nr:hypothetical protein [Streptosporangium becharense]MBB2915226.1 hypothetical protein [Streptosporangium becharense]